MRCELWLLCLLLVRLYLRLFGVLVIVVIVLIVLCGSVVCLRLVCRMVLVRLKMWCSDGVVCLVRCCLICLRICGMLGLGVLLVWCSVWWCLVSLLWIVVMMGVWL